MIRGRLLVPGNLLLAGEYAVLFQGRVGVSMAVGPPVVVHVEPHEHLQFVAEAGRDRVIWEAASESSDEPSARLSAQERRRRTAVFSCVTDYFGDRERLRSAARRAAPEHSARILDRCGPLTEGQEPGVRITVDSRTLFDQNGRKLGFGSSAAATVAAVAGMLAALGIDPVALRSLVHVIATETHRDVQGGRGSGYDVATSCFGGVGLFVGGEHTAYRAIDASWLPEVGIMAGESAQSTSDAITRFRRYYETFPEETEALLDRSDRACRSIAAAGSWEQAREGLDEARAVGIEIGDRIGIPAGVKIPAISEGSSPGCHDRFMKALGAGSETIATIPFRAGCADRLTLRDNGGLRWA